MSMGETCKTPRAASPGGTPEPGEEGQRRSLVGMRHDALQGERAALWERGSFEELNREGQPAPGSPR